MALLEAVKPFKYLGRKLAPGDPVEPDPESATLARQLVEHRFARYTTSSPTARPAGSGRGRRARPATTTPTDA